MEHRHSLAQNDHGEDDEHDKQDEHDEENEVSFEQGDSNRETSPETSVDTSVDDNEALIKKLTNVLEKVKINVFDNLDNEEAQKSTKSMIKSFQRRVKGNIQTLSTTLISVGKEVTAPAKRGTKRRKNNF